MKTGTALLRDIGTVFWKEGKEVLMNISGSRGWLGILTFLFVFGVLLPIQGGREWIGTPVSVASWVWLPMLLVSGVIADAIAGERERHTLETLLSGRLPDAAIFLGKIMAAVLYGCCQVWLIAITSAVAVNAAYWNGNIAFYSPALVGAILLYPALIGGIAAGAASLLAVGAESARQAQQMSSVISFLFFVPVLLLNIIPESLKQRLGAWLEKADWNLIAMAFPAALFLLMLILLYAGYRKFTRIELLKKGG